MSLSTADSLFRDVIAQQPVRFTSQVKGGFCVRLSSYTCTSFQRLFGRHCYLSSSPLSDYNIAHSPSANHTTPHSISIKHATKTCFLWWAMRINTAYPIPKEAVQTRKICVKSGELFVNTMKNTRKPRKATSWKKPGLHRAQIFFGWSNHQCVCLHVPLITYESDTKLTTDRRLTRSLQLLTVQTAECPFDTISLIDIPRYQTCS